MNSGINSHNFGNDLPSLLKIGGFIGAWGMIWLPLAIPLAKRCHWSPFAPLTPQQKLPLLGSLYLMAPLLWGVLFRVENSTFADYGLVWNLALFYSLVLGMAIAIGSLVIIFGLQGIWGGIAGQLGNFARLPALILPLLALGLSVSLIEEVIFRGIFLTQLQTDFSPPIAAVISSGLFALLHLVWERQLTLPQIPGLWLMGMVLVWARWSDNDSLGLAWGLHAGWI
jgi:membrane protease YdiL (CAAX protease family)